MNSLINYILEYKGVALHNGRKSIGTPDGISHEYKEGTLELDYDGEYGQPYAFIYNKKKNIVLFSEAGETHHDVFDTYKDTKEGDAAGLGILDNTKQLRYTGPRYAYSGKDPKKEMSDWYEKNKNILKELCEGRIWYLENIKWEIQQYDEDWIEDHRNEVNKFPKLNKNIRAYIAFWNDIPAGKFKEYCDNIVKELNKQKSKDKPIEEYVAIGNNGEPIFMNINEAPKVKIEQRKSSFEKEIDQIWKYHADISDEGRKKKRELMKGYIKSRGEHFQKERYNKTDSKSAAEFHNKFAKRYDPKSGKMTWGEKIGDSLQMKNIIDYINESNNISVDISKWNINDIPEDSAIDIKTIKGYSGINFSIYKYFGDCKNTVDKDKMWDATQMSNWINNCGLISVVDVLEKLNNGDRKIPVKFNKIVNKLKENNKLNDLSEICCGMDDYQKMMFIYLTETDTHYFFDCKR